MSIARVSAVAAFVAVGCCVLSGRAASEFQVGPYIGVGSSTTLSDIHGLHENAPGVLEDTKAESVEANERLALGVNSRYYFCDFFGVQADAKIALTDYPEQDVVVGGNPRIQPQSHWNFLAFSAGPVLRYKGAGFWETFNPYVGASALLLAGSATDVDTTPVYGQGGRSSLGGTGYNLSVGAEYGSATAGVMGEYRYEYAEFNIDHFRSYKWNGVDITKESSFILFGGFLRF